MLKASKSSRRTVLGSSRALSEHREYKQTPPLRHPKPEQRKLLQSFPSEGLPSAWVVFHILRPTKGTTVDAGSFLRSFDPTPSDLFGSLVLFVQNFRKGIVCTPRRLLAAQPRPPTGRFRSTSPAARLPHDSSARVELQTSLSTLEKWAEPLREQSVLAFKGK